VQSHLLFSLRTNYFREATKKEACVKFYPFEKGLILSALPKSGSIFSKLPFCVNFAYLLTYLLFIIPFNELSFIIFAHEVENYKMKRKLRSLNL